jgi:hypothetical protein
MTLQNEFQWYLNHQNELVKKYNGKHLVIKNKAVVGAYDTPLEALTDAKKNYETGTFLIQLCTPGDEAYTHHFHSRVAFV